MSTDYSAWLAIGFVIPLEEFLDPLRAKEDAKFHYEKRWDPKTGKLLTDERVIDKPVLNTLAR